jgi:hypothetical protein
MADGACRWQAAAVPGHAARRALTPKDEIRRAQSRGLKIYGETPQVQEFDRLSLEGHHLSVVVGPRGLDDLAVLGMYLYMRLDAGLLLHDRHLGCRGLGPRHLEDIDGPLPGISPLYTGR